MAFTYVTRDGSRLTPWMLREINRLDADLYRLFKVHVRVTSGIRTYEEQKKIFLERYVIASKVNGRKVYDTRVWNGVRYYRISSAGTVAVPGSSNHEIQGTKAAVDIRDTGADAGITVKGSTRGKWIRANASKYSLIASGDGFREGWHFDMTGIDRIPGTGIPSGSGGKLVEDGELGPATIKALQTVLGVTADGDWGAKTTTALQTRLVAVGQKISIDGDLGPATIRAMQVFLLGGDKADSIMGPNTIRGLQHYLNSGGKFRPAGWLEPDGQLGSATIKRLQAVLGVSQDGEIGPATVTALQKKLVAMGHKITVDGDLGPATIKALQSVVKSTADGELGPNTIKALQNYLNAGGKFPPATTTPPVTPPPTTVPGRNATSRPLADIQKFLKVPVTNKWDLATANATKAFQKSKFVDEDYIWGVTCDGFAFPPANVWAFGVDYSFARPSADLLSMRTVRFAARYLWRTVQSDGKTNKGLSKAEYNSLMSKGIQVAFIYEEDGKELTLGYDAGVRVAKAAEAYRNEQGLPVKPIYFNVDFNATDSTQLAKIWDALRGVASVIGIKRVGLYAGYNVIKAAFDQKLITFGMQTYAWSNGQWDSRAQLRQWSNNQWGGSVDFQYAMAAEFGQTPIVPAPEPEPDPDPDPKPEDSVLVDREHLETVRENLKLVLSQVESLLG